MSGKKWHSRRVKGLVNEVRVEVLGNFLRVKAQGGTATEGCRQGGDGDLEVRGAEMG
jgi:hypothetical protein